VVWSDPFVATETVAVAPGHQLEAGSKRGHIVPRCAARIRREPVKRVRIAHCPLALLYFLHPMMQVAVRKGEG
jgi:hypothetical protein